MKNIKNIKFVIFALAIMIIAGFYLNGIRITDAQTRMYETIKTSVLQKAKLMEQRMVGKKLNISVSKYKNLKEKKLLFIYNNLDCSSCIEKGFKIIKNIDSLKNGLTQVITNYSNVSKVQLDNTYDKEILIDDNNLIKRELNFNITPLLLFVNDQFVIEKAYIPTIYHSAKDDNAFISDFIRRIRMK